MLSNNPQALAKSIRAGIMDRLCERSTRGEMIESLIIGEWPDYGSMSEEGQGEVYDAVCQVVNEATTIVLKDLKQHWPGIYDSSNDRLHMS